MLARQRRNWPTVSPVRVRSASTAAHYETMAARRYCGTRPARSGWSVREVGATQWRIIVPGATATRTSLATLFLPLTELSDGTRSGHVFRVVYAQEGVR